MHIEYFPENRRFVLTTARSTYAMAVNGAGALVHLYWGARVDRVADLPAAPSGQDHVSHQEYAAWGEYFFDEPALKATFADGVRDTRLRYVEHAIVRDGAASELRIVLRDCHYPLAATLVYRLYDDCDVIDRHAVLTNEGSDPITLECMQSAVWHPPVNDGYRLSYQTGRWGKEYRPQEWTVGQGKAVLETRRGTSGPDCTPFFWLDAAGKADEERGEIWCGALHWSGNWKITVEQNRADQVRVTGGINDFDCTWVLRPGEPLVTPVFSGLYADGGFGAVSRAWHDYQREHVMRPEKAHRPLPLIYNSWGTFQFDIDEKRMIDLARLAAGIGVELFVIDDGWFGKRDNDRCALGDWQPSPTKFPNGLGPLIQAVNDLGMDFGIWLEPEMVSPDSDLCRAHPDWVFQFENRTGSQYRHQFVLNLAREDVKEFTYRTMHDLLRDHNIRYFKLDNNRYISEPGWSCAELADQQSVWIRYYQNFHEIMARLVRAFPDVIFENCASGGGRVDFGMHRHFDRINRSDNQDPLDELFLHEGFTQAILPRLAGGGCHISKGMAHINGRLAPRRFQAHVGMLGSLAIGENLFTCTAEELEELRGYTALYKQIRPITHGGDFHRLLSPRQNPRAAFEYVSKDGSEAVVFVLGTMPQFRDTLPNVRLRGLRPETVYEVEGYAPMSGAGLMRIGLPVKLRGDYDSKVIRLRAVSQS